MNLQEALNSLHLAVQELAKAVVIDDKTPLGSALGLAEVSSLVGTGGENPDVVVFGDLNRFKGINDRFGHAAGDVAISTVGNLIQELFVQGCNAQAFRRSGDEFVILLSANRLEDFKSHLKSFAPCPFNFEGIIHLTAMSFGYALTEGEIDFGVMLARAETACQSAKAEGDGICVAWSRELEQDVLIHLRDRCPSCSAQIKINVPQATAPKDNKLLSCPCCGNKLP